MASYSEKITLISGNANRDLSEAIGKHLGIPLAKAHVGRFPDQEIDIKVEEDLRGSDCFVIQSTCPPVNDNWVEMLLLLDTLRRSSAGRITAVMPYYGYARKDRKDEGRVPISAKVVANTLIASGADRVVTLDMHAAQIQGFFDIPVDHLYARPVMIERVRQLGANNVKIVSPDIGGTKLARAYAKDLGCDLAIIDKRRISGEKTVIEHIIGEVEGHDVVLVDDMVSTGGSIVDAARIVKEKGANKVFLVATHGVLAGNAVERLNKADVEKILFADTIPLQDRPLESLEVVSMAQLLARAIDRIHRSESVSMLFESER